MSKATFAHVFPESIRFLHSKPTQDSLGESNSHQICPVWVDPERNLIKNYPYFITSSYLKAHDSCSKQDFRDVFGYRAGNPHCWASGYGWGRHRHCVPMPRMQLNPQLWVLSTPTMIRKISAIAKCTRSFVRSKCHLMTTRSGQRILPFRFMLWHALTIFRAQSLQHAQGLSSQISSNIFPDLPSTKKHLSLKRFCTLHVDEWLICCVTLGNRCKCWNNVSYRNINNLHHLESRFSSPSKLASTLCPLWSPWISQTPSAGDPWPWFAPSVIRIPTEVCRVCFGRWKVTGRSWDFQNVWTTMIYYVHYG